MTTKTIAQLLFGGMENSETESKSLDKLAVIIKTADYAFSTVRYIVKYTFWAIVVISAALTIRTLAGTSTQIGFNFLVELWSGLDLGSRYAWVVAAAAIIYGLLQSKLRKRTIKYLHGRIKELELKQDPNRSSSGLTEKGETPKKDKL